MVAGSLRHLFQGYGAEKVDDGEIGFAGIGVRDEDEEGAVGFVEEERQEKEDVELVGEKRRREEEERKEERWRRKSSMSKSTRGGEVIVDVQKVAR